MHELSLCGAIVDTVTDHAKGRFVERVDLRLGHFRQVVPSTLQFCWEMRIEGTDLEGCELAVDHVHATIVCRACGATTVLEHPILLCDTCDSADVELRTGEEFLIVSIDLAPEDAPATGSEADNAHTEADTEEVH